MKIQLHVSTFSYLQTLVNCFKAIRHVQTQLEETSSLSLHLIFPISAMLKQQLKSVLFGGLDVETLLPEPTTAFATAVHHRLDDTKMHDL